MTIGLGAALALGGFNAFGSWMAGREASNAAATSANAAITQKNLAIRQDQWNTKWGSAMTMWNANNQERLGKENLKNQINALTWGYGPGGILAARGDIDRAQRINIFENSPENIATRKRKIGENLASKILETNARLDGMFGESTTSKKARRLLGIF